MFKATVKEFLPQQVIFSLYTLLNFDMNPTHCCRQEVISSLNKSQ